MLEGDDSSRENQTKNKKTLGPGESEVWSGRGDWACPLTCKVFLFFFGFLEWNPHLLATALGFFSLFQFSRSALEVWLGMPTDPLPDNTSEICVLVLIYKYVGI